MLSIEDINTRFKTWWHEEGKFMVPSTTDYEATKELIRTAWFNGVHVALESIEKDKGTHE